MARLIDADVLMESIRKALGIKSMAKSLLLPAEKAIIDQIDSAPTVGGWINAKDRLPESSGIKVIVSAKTTPESVMQTKAVFIAFLGYGDGKWYTPDVDFMASAKTGNDNIHPVWEITHWMFLPEPQKDGDRDA